MNLLGCHAAAVAGKIDSAKHGYQILEHGVRPADGAAVTNFSHKAHLPILKVCGRHVMHVWHGRLPLPLGALFRIG